MDGVSDLTLTGQLGDVMKESARIALSYVRSHADELGIAGDSFNERTFHVHVPAGAIPKDGPSAGITMSTALASLLTGRPVRHTDRRSGQEFFARERGRVAEQDLRLERGVRPREPRLPQPPGPPDPRCPAASGESLRGTRSSREG